jgi:hypothetical protein
MASRASSLFECASSFLNVFLTVLMLSGRVVLIAWINKQNRSCFSTWSKNNQHEAHSIALMGTKTYPNFVQRSFLLNFSSLKQILKIIFCCCHHSKDNNIIKLTLVESSLAVKRPKIGESILNLINLGAHWQMITFLLFWMSSKMKKLYFYGVRIITSLFKIPFGNS